MHAVVISIFDDTKVINIYENTKSKFEADLCDSMGEYRAIVKRVSKNTVLISFEGSWQNRLMSTSYAKWDFEYIWRDLAEQGVIVEALL